MNIEQITQLVELFEQSNLSLLEVGEGATKVRMEKGGAAALSVVQAPPAPLQNIQAQPAPPAVAVSDAAATVNFNELKTVRSPLVGVFYAAPAPDAAPFVSVGTRVKKGDVLCVIEAMKLINEIVAENDGEIVDICVQNGQLVEFSQVLFKLF